VISVTRQHGMTLPAHANAFTVVIGSLRGGASAWLSLLKHVLVPSNSDLALLGPREPKEESLLYKYFSYRWIVADEKEWGNVLSHAAGCSSAWRQLCTRSKHDEFLGGVQRCGNHRASGGIISAYRYAFSRLLVDEAKIFSSYDWIILIRSDFLFSSPLPECSKLEPNAIYMPHTQRT